MTNRRWQSGFTLLEVLIAAVLIGSVFVAVVSLMTQSLRNIDRMRPHEIAMQHAREVMNLELLRDELQPGMQSGQWSDGYRWRAEIVPLDFVGLGKSYDAPQPVLPATGGPGSTVVPGTKTLFLVKVQVAWGARATYDLQTMQWALWPLPKQQ